MKKFATVLGACALATASAASAQPAPAAGATAAPRKVDMTGAPVAEPVSGAKVLMLRTMVSDIERSVKFYTAVFGMTAMGMPNLGGPRPAPAPGAAPARPAGPGGPGGGIRILTFPGGSPGMIMIKGSGGPDMMRGSYVIQVPDLAKVLAAAEANGGKVQTTRFTAGGQESRHVLDPDGNDLEIMQSGPAPRPAAK